MALRKVLNDLLSRPTAREQSGLRVGKAPLQVGHKAIVGTRSTEMIRVLNIKRLVSSAWSTCELKKVDSA